MSVQVSSTTPFSPLADCTNDTLQAHNRANNAVCLNSKNRASGNGNSNGSSGSTHRPATEKPPVRWTRHNPYAACVLDPEHSIDYKDSTSAAPASTYVSGLTVTSRHECKSVDISVVSRRCGGYSVLNMPFISAVRSSSSPYARDTTATPLTAYPSQLSAPHSCTQDEMLSSYHEANNNNRNNYNYNSNDTNNIISSCDYNSTDDNDNNEHYNYVYCSSKSNGDSNNCSPPKSELSSNHNNTSNNTGVHVVACSACNSNRQMRLAADSVFSNNNNNILSSVPSSSATAHPSTLFDTSPAYDLDMHRNENCSTMRGAAASAARSPSSVPPMHNSCIATDCPAHSLTEKENRTALHVEQSATRDMHACLASTTRAHAATSCGIATVSPSSAVRSKASHSHNNSNRSNNSNNSNNDITITDNTNSQHMHDSSTCGSRHAASNEIIVTRNNHVLSSTSAALVHAVSSVMKRKNTQREAVTVVTAAASSSSSMPSRHGLQQQQQQYHNHGYSHDKKHMCGTAADQLPACRVEVRVDMRHTTADFIIDDVCHIFGSALDSEALLGRYVIVEGDRGEDMGSIMAILGGDLPCMTIRSNTDNSNEDAAGTQDQENLMSNNNNNTTNSNGNSKNSSNYKNSRVMLRVLRAATEEEIGQLDELERDERKALKHCQECLARVHLHVPIAIEGVIFQFDKKKLTVRYTSDSYVDFNTLTRALHTQYKCRIWMDQLNRDLCEGVRDRRRAADTKKRFVRGYGKRRDS